MVPAEDVPGAACFGFLGWLFVLAWGGLSWRGGMVRLGRRGAVGVVPGFQSGVVCD